ncbi:alpha/beta fold hydrolase [Streptomyces sp. NPDC048191]|uniref:alpha/beta fold hydrolase n=1 Tax=Streptomyces sp. NPDC048191 TaxID=3155484 RepID=UPI0033DAA299
MASRDLHTPASGLARHVMVPFPDGARLSTYIDGPDSAQGTVFLVHGLFATSALWHRHVPLLTGQNLRVVRYDQRGHGWSTPGTAPLALDRLADDLAYVIDHVAPRGPLVLGGHSMGAMVLMRATARHPHLTHKISGLVLISPPPVGASTRTETGIKHLFAAAGRDLLATVCTHAPGLMDIVRRQLPASNRWALRPFVPSHVPAKPPHRAGLHLLRTADIAALWNDLTGQQHDLAPVRALGWRVRILAGAQDVHIPAAQTCHLAGELPQARLELVAHATHHLPASHPQLIAAQMAAALI